MKGAYPLCGTGCKTIPASLALIIAFILFSGIVLAGHPAGLDFTPPDTEPILGSEVTFASTWTDQAEPVSMYVCGSSSFDATSPGCPVTEWCSDSGDTEGSSSCSYGNAQESDWGSHNFYAYLVDGTASSSDDYYYLGDGSFNVYNRAPAIASASIDPQEPNAGDTVTFSADWTHDDGAYHGMHMFVCKSDAPSPPAYEYDASLDDFCGAGTENYWCDNYISSGQTSGTNDCSVQIDDAGDYNYYIYLVDELSSHDDGYSSASGSFTVTTSVSPPVFVGQPSVTAEPEVPDSYDVMFEAQWQNPQAVPSRVFFCSHDADPPQGIDDTDNFCAGGEAGSADDYPYCYTSKAIEQDPPAESCTYNIQSGASGSLLIKSLGQHEFYAYVINEGGEYSEASGTFNVYGECPGGTCSDNCDDGCSCLDDSDCTSGNCDSGTCTTDPCSNGVKDGDETDVDCGGGSCPKCANGKVCQVDSDCTSGNCDSGTCKSTGGGGGAPGFDMTFLNVIVSGLFAVLLTGFVVFRGSRPVC